MARGLDSDYIGSLSLMDGFDMRINFHGFGENMKKFMELPIKYLDSAHDKAVRLVEDIHALIYAPCPDNELSNEGQRTLMDPCSNNPIIGYPPTSAEMEKANPDEEVSSSSSLLTVEDSSLCSTATDAPETESVSSKSSDSCASEDSISLERTASTKEETILCNSENLPDSGTPENCNSLVRTVSSEEELILWNPGNSVKPPQPPEQATIVQDYASQETNTESGSTPGHRDTESSACDGAILLGMITEYGEEKSGLGLYTDSHEDSTKHGNTMIFAGETSSHYLSADLFGGADDPNMLADEMTDFVDIDLLDGEERMKDDKAEASLVGVPLAKNSSFKRVFMRSLSNKLRWSKKDMNVHQAVPIRPHEAVNACYEVIPSSDDLQDDWELL